MLRLNFTTLRGDCPTLMLAPCVRFSADGTLRGPDNYVIARCLEGRWQVGGRLHRELACEGPVRLRLTLEEHQPPRMLGPFREVHTRGGVLYADDACLNIPVPGSTPVKKGDRSPFSVTFEGGLHAET
ncbi:MAG TPA: hypothetical protein VM146_06120 [Steroidobacteraceae bacterium]|nr:hypothetical protein [Steroidobacteraceae bacterium]